MKQLLIISGFEQGGSLADAPEHALKFEHAAVVVEKAEGETCERCWIVSTDVGENDAHPTLCSR